MPKQGALQSNEMFFSAIHRVVDLFVIFFSGWLISNWVYPLEFKTTHLLIVLFSYSFIFYFTTIFSPLYNSWRSETIATELKHLLLYWGLSLAIFRFSIDYILINVNVEKSINLEFGMIWQFTIISLLVSYRVILRYLLRWIRAKGLNSRKVVIVGTGQAARQFGQKINENVGLGFDLLGFYGKPLYKEDQACNKNEGDGEINHNLGDFSSLITDAKNKKFDRIYIVLPLSEQHLTNDLINELSDTTVNVYIIPDVLRLNCCNRKSKMLSAFQA